MLEPNGRLARPVRQVECGRPAPPVDRPKPKPLPPRGHDTVMHPRF